MKAARRLVLALALLAVACDRSPTGVPCAKPPDESAMQGGDRVSAACFEPKRESPPPAPNRNSNYAVAW